MCTNYSSEPISPAHIFECLGLTKQDFADDPLLVLDYLRVYDVMWTCTGPIFQTVSARSTKAAHCGEEDSNFIQLTFHRLDLTLSHFISCDRHLSANKSSGDIAGMSAREGFTLTVEDDENDYRWFLAIKACTSHFSDR
ncbi:hypothetical protein TNCV_3276491 [Trichonephila clavipes]|nr:hypothetical protein TNCV_3276491 [Trichonephila clavipes]